jgi:hypothetical protein
MSFLLLKTYLGLPKIMLKPIISVVNNMLASSASHQTIKIKFIDVFTVHNSSISKLAGKVKPKIGFKVRRR